MKKLLAILLTAGMMLAMLAGCKSSEAPQAPAESVSGDTETAEAPKQESPFAEMSLTDLEGNEADQTLFADHDLTMINIWATFCNPCLREMPDLGLLQKEYADSDKKVQIVGLVADVTDMAGNADPGQLDLAKQVVAQTQAEYTHLLPSETLMNFMMNNVSGFPTTYFVDAEGNLVGDPVVGARSGESWKKEIENRLAQMGK